MTYDQREDLYAVGRISYSPNYRCDGAHVFNAQEEITKLKERIAKLESSVLRELRNTSVNPR